jgi:hypothetical protein
MTSAYRLSLGANLVLVGAIAVLLWRDRPAAPAPSTPALSVPSVTADRSDTSQDNSVPTGEASSPTNTAKLNPTAVAQLEQMGISRDILIHALLEDFNRRSEQQVAELQRKYAPRLVPDRAIVEFGRQNEAERIRELKAALGEDGYRAWDKAETLRALNQARPPGDPLPMNDAEAEQAYRLQKAFDDKAAELRMAMEDGVADRADGSALQAQAQQTLDKELEKLLGQARFDQLRGNAAPTLEVYRTFGDLSPTPAQAQAVVQAQAEYRTRETTLMQRLNENPADAGKLAAELKTMRTAQEEKLAQIFGREVYEQQKRQNDPTYKALQQYADAWELRGDELQSVYQNLRVFQDQAEQTRSFAEFREAAGQRVNWREIDAAIEQARQQTESGLQMLIGSERLRRLKQNGMLAAR